MKPLNFNSDSWSMFDNIASPNDHSEESFQGLDIISALEDISSANVNDEPFCELSEREYTH